MIQVFAPAKINLTLHVTGQRDDGYHLLDSLVVFADVVDELYVQNGNTVSITVEGPEATAVPVDMDNLVLKVAHLFRDGPEASFLLTKNLPVASGIGGGSADAAAAFRGLMAHWSGGEVSEELYNPKRTPLAKKLLDLGADIPVCLMSRTARLRGIGEEIDFIDNIPVLHAVLVNPRVGVSTPDVFRSLASNKNPPMQSTFPSFSGSNHFVEWLSEQRNDLEAPAISIEPEIAIIKDVLIASTQCQLARMSGSGATCFGLYPHPFAAKAAAEAIQSLHPEWWVRKAVLGTQTKLALPRLS